MTKRPLYDKLFGTSVCIYTVSEKVFIEANPICRDCLVRPMCIRPTKCKNGIVVRVCERLYTHFQIVKRNDKNLIKFK